ncbi:uncharacterized protein LOC130781422 [Actinidia eriantha]|uniref:uncharacterized protein LOC130781422 n=1 Tax=Actinidia eriantha TaxID=165200 RepID=UPI00258E8CC2|nr:uncharacterized protein LOC130781422 [Actinidia eriantha]
MGTGPPIVRRQRGSTETRPRNLTASFRRNGEGERRQPRNGPHRSPPRNRSLRFSNPKTPIQTVSYPQLSLSLSNLALLHYFFSGIVTFATGEVKDNQVIQCLDRLKQLNSDQKDVDEIIVLFDKLSDLCSIEGSGNAAIATRNGGVELVCSVCSDCLKLSGGTDQGLVSALKAMASLLHGHVYYKCTLLEIPPDNAARAIESGAGDLAIQAMQKFPGAHQILWLGIQKTVNTFFLMRDSSQLLIISNGMYFFLLGIF